MAAHYVWGAKEADAHKPQRVCSRCFDALLPLQPHIVSTVSKAVMTPDYRPTGWCSAGRSRRESGRRRVPSAWGDCPSERRWGRGWGTGGEGKSC